jgi:sulfate transport system permease protein
VTNAPAPDVTGSYQVPAARTFTGRGPRRGFHWGRLLLITLALAFLAAFLLLPLLVVFAQALSKGVSAYLSAISDPMAWASIKLTMRVAAIAVPSNVVFGMAAAWAITKFEFRGKSTLITLIDLPFAVSPVIAGLTYILIFGAHGWFGPYLQAHDIHVVFAVPGIVLATIFVTFPFVARELIPVMQALGKDDEETALSLGAGGWQHPLGPAVRGAPLQCTRHG